MTAQAGYRTEARALHAWLVLPLLLSLMSACGGSAKMAEPSHQHDDLRKQQIGQLWQQIGEMERGERLASSVLSRDGAGDVCAATPARAPESVQGGAPTRPTAPRAEEPDFAREVCPDPDGERDQRCTDVCTLSDAICTNAYSICRIANQLGDDWARGRCDAARDSCARADQRCCDCQ